MVVLGVAWLVLLVIELTRGLSPPLEAVSTGIWIAFILDFALRLILAPRKSAYLKRNWLTAISLLVPALRVFRALRAFRAVRAARGLRGVRLVKVVGSVNRAMAAVGRATRERHLGYVLAITAIVLLAGAAGMYAFERDASSADGAGIRSYGDALWWTAMIMTTLGSDFWPRTPEGRILCVLLALYAFGVFGYLTAALASYFIGRDARRTGR
jgi:voltage-gated potassium channel